MPKENADTARAYMLKAIDEECDRAIFWKLDAFTGKKARKAGSWWALVCAAVDIAHEKLIIESNRSLEAEVEYVQTKTYAICRVKVFTDSGQ